MLWKGKPIKRGMAHQGTWHTLAIVVIAPDLFEKMYTLQLQKSFEAPLGAIMTEAWLIVQCFSVVFALTRRQKRKKNAINAVTCAL